MQVSCSNVVFLDRVADSPACEIFNQVFARRARGEGVVSLAIGEPSFDTPEEIIEPAHSSVKRENEQIEAIPQESRRTEEGVIQE